MVLFFGLVFSVALPEKFYADVLAAEWSGIDEYQTSLALVSDSSVINDFAERGVAMIQEYEQILSKYEEKRKYLLQVDE